MASGDFSKKQARLYTLFFGSFDRVLSTISFFVGLVSLVFSILVYFSPTPTPTYLIIRDILIVLLLTFSITVLAIKYYKKTEMVEDFRDLLTHQIVSDQQLIDKFRNHFFCNIRSNLITENDLQNKIDSIRREYFNKVCQSVLTDTRDIFKDYFEARGLKIEEDLVITIKLLLSRDEAQKIMNRIKGPKADTLSELGQYIATAFRDPFTWEKKPERKEINGEVYRLEENTTFNNIINLHKPFFLSNNLHLMVSKGEYKNQHANWQKYYNSVLAVPICYKPDENNNNNLYYGVLSIDSLNPKGFDLFNDNIAYNMLLHSADTLAIMFGNIDILERFVGNQNGSN
jgi:hypothetical protein